MKSLLQQISLKQQILDILRRILHLQTRLNKLKMEEIVRRICKEEGMSQRQEDTIVAVVWCESNMDPKAIGKNKNGTTDFGLIQANSYWYIQRMKLITKDEALNNPEKCVRLMCQRFKKGRADDWVCYGTKKYIKFLEKKGRQQNTIKTY